MPAEHEELTLTFTFPVGVSPEQPGDAVFDAEARTLTMVVINNKGQFGITAHSILDNTFIAAVLLEGNNKLAEASVLVYIKEQFEVTSAGGFIEAQGGKIKLNIPADTFSGDTIIAIGEPSGDAVPVYSLLGQPFEIKAQDKKSKTDLHQLKNNVEIQVSFAELEISEDKLMNLFLYWYNPQIEQWEALTSFADPETKVIKGRTDHFSVLRSA